LGSTGTYCTICLCEYEDQEELRVLHCKHAFHKQCIDQWISKYVNNCPVCRGDGVKRKERNSSENQNNTNDNNANNNNNNNQNSTDNSNTSHRFNRRNTNLNNALHNK